MKGINRIQWCSVVLLVFSLTACKVKRPETVLPDAKMENVLYDYHIAKAMGEEVPYNESYKRVLYRRVDMAAYLSVDGYAPGQQDNVYVAIRHQFPRP